jgi:putative PIN family toxin of toxin-antitoxin system
MTLTSLSMSSDPKKIVIDTNVLLSAAIYPSSPSAQALLTAFTFCEIYHSRETLHEIRTVLNRPKFDRYFLDAEFTRDLFLAAYIDKSIEAEITQVSTDCQDPKDNMFLSLALSVGASIIVSGDTKHLIPMHPYKGIEILLPKDFDQRI